VLQRQICPDPLQLAILVLGLLQSCTQSSKYMATMLKRRPRRIDRKTNFIHPGSFGHGGVDIDDAIATTPACIACAAPAIPSE
jgi:hypothetical protein